MSCPTCRTWNTTGLECVQVPCLACGVVQCHSNGLGKGACKVCHAGMLPGWSGNNNPEGPDGRGLYPLAMPSNDRLCGYAGCDAPAVYCELPGAKPKACKVHGDRVVERLAARRAAARGRP